MNPRSHKHPDEHVTHVRLIEAADALLAARTRSNSRGGPVWQFDDELAKSGLTQVELVEGMLFLLRTGLVDPLEWTRPTKP